MQKVFVFVLSLLCFAFLGTSVYAEGDPSRFSLDSYSDTELNTIRDLIFNQQSPDAGDVVVDKEGLLIEWNGLTRNGYDKGMPDIIITNLTGDDIRLKLSSHSINSLKLDTWNNDFDISAGERVILSTKHNFMFSVERVIEEYGIDHITSYSMELEVTPVDDKETILFEASFSVALDMPISELWSY